MIRLCDPEVTLLVAVVFIVYFGDCLYNALGDVSFIPIAP